MVTKAKSSNKSKKAPKKTSKKKKGNVSSDLNKIDVVFVIDSTGSMGPYIAEAKKYAAHIISKIMFEKELDIRVALIAYRDHPPQEYSYVANVYDFNSVNNFNKNLAPLDANGGGDRPEAVWDGVNELFKLSWREKSDRVVYLVGDSPAHEQCPCGLTPDGLIENLQKFGIELNAHSIAGFADTTKHFKLLADATGGEVSTGSTVQDTTKLYTDSLVGHSYSVDAASVFVASAGTSYTSAASLTAEDAITIGTSAGLTEEESINTHKYLRKRGL